MKEWKSIPGLEGRYAASSDGEIMSMDYRGTGLPGILKPQINRNGYAKVCVGGRKMIAAHSLVMLAFVGPRPYRMDINHCNGIKHDNRLENLHYCTTAENVRHAHASGRCNPARGENHPAAKLTDDLVRQIRRMAKQQFTYKEISEITNTSVSNISNVARGKIWTHVKDEETT